jgi:uncharacterized cupredoxin-like copper-binding protein
VLLAVVACAVGVSTGCGGGSKSGAVPLVRVSERDFHIQAPRQVRAGEVRLRLENEGPDTHELIVVRQVPGQAIPLRSDGLTVDEEALEGRTVATFEGVERGGSHDELVVLKPGRYLLLCNMAGHYLGGMHTTLVVR